MFRRYPIRTIMLAVFGLATCAGIAYVGFVLLLAQAINGVVGNDSACNAINPVGVESIGEFKLPPHSKLFYANCWGWQGISVEAYFTMIPDELNAFLATTNIRPPLSATSRPDKLICTCKSEGVTSYLYGSSKKLEWEEEVFINTSNKTLYTVYFTVLGG